MPRCVYVGRRTKCSTSQGLGPLGKPMGILDAKLPKRPWLLIGLIVPLGVLAVSTAALFGKVPLLPSVSLRSGSAGWLVIAGAAGIIVMSLAASIDYRKGIHADDPDVADLLAVTDSANTVTVRPTLALWASLGGYVLVAACGVANIVLPRFVRTGWNKPTDRSRAGDATDG